jgi:pimeloyl-ACP methyl ester carboxylesterase
MKSRIAKWTVMALAALLALFALAVGLNWAPDHPVETLTARWAPPPSTFIDVRGLKTHVRDEGPRDDPAPLVLIHGTSSSLHTWEGWVAAFKGERRVITMDLPGFGLTGPNAQDDYRTAAYVSFVIDVLDALAVKKCVLAGNSLGGEIAWHVAVSSPERIERLILVDSAGYPMQSQSIPIGFRIARIPGLNRIMEFTLPRSLVASSVRNVYGDPARVTEALIDRYEALTLRSGNRHALVRRFEQSDFGADASRIATIRQPTLILWGGRDRLIPVDNARHFARDIAASRLVIFDDLGHVPQEEDPARTAAAVRDFVKP